MATQVAARVWLRLSGKAVLLGAVAAVCGVAGASILPSRALVEVADLGNPVISPDGRKVAYRLVRASVERDKYDTVWYVQALAGSAEPRRVSDGGVPLREYNAGLVAPAPAAWSPDGRWIYYRMLMEGRIAVWRSAEDGSGAGDDTAAAAEVRALVLEADGRPLTNKERTNEW